MPAQELKKRPRFFREEVLQLYSGSLNGDEQDTVRVVQDELRRAIDQRKGSIIGLLTAVGLRLASHFPGALEQFIEENVSEESIKGLEGDHRLSDDEVSILEDMVAFIEYCRENRLNYELVCHTLMHDIRGITDPRDWCGGPGYPRPGFSPRVKGFSKIDWDAWANDPELMRENAAINAEFASSEADGIEE
ncbi:MAG TPA: hypothetical protein VKX17_08325 [Planctomycetota bacterium]|nr:hypothetical protein [Planctomycetota bacterium]